MPADVGQGSTTELVGVGLVEVESLDIPEQAITAHDTTVVSDTEQQFTPGRLKKNGMVKGKVFVGDEGTMPEIGWPGDILVTLPTPAGMTTPRSYTYGGFVSRVGGVTIQADGVLAYDFDFTVNSAVMSSES